MWGPRDSTLLGVGLAPGRCDTQPLTSKLPESQAEARTLREGFRTAILASHLAQVWLEGQTSMSRQLERLASDLPQTAMPTQLCKPMAPHRLMGTVQLAQGFRS